MRTDSASRSGSFIEAARRAQIIEAAIAVVNDVGYANASLARIAAHARTSKSVVSYHFAGKEDLLRSVVESVFADSGTTIAAAVEGQPTWPARLEAYVRSELNEFAHHGDRFRAATEILISHRDPEGRPLMLAEEIADLSYLEGIIAGGVRAGVFSVPDVPITATTISHAIDGALTSVQRNPGVDLAAYSEALIPILLAAVGARQ